MPSLRPAQKRSVGVPTVWRGHPAGAGARTLPDSGHRCSRYASMRRENLR